jgi:Transcriptional regulators of sugar metabolism
MPTVTSGLPVQRRGRILELLRSEGVVRTASLAAALNVDVATVRRDLHVLSLHHPIRIVHGGATLTHGAAGVLQELDLATKQVTNLAAKRTIARKAASLIHDGETIAFNAGSTVALVLDYLPANLTELTVVTLGLNIAVRAVAVPYVTLFLPGGYYRRSSQALTGPTAVRVLEGIHVDRAFLGAVAVDIDAGWTHPSHVEVDTNQLLLRMAAHPYLVADSSKFDSVSFAKVCDLRDFEGLIVDDDLPHRYREWAATEGVAVI